MRKTKFRAFDTVNREMVVVRTIDFDEVGEVEEVNTSTYVWSQNANPPNLDKLMLMQFTGLHDKDGKEIYEGDIVHSSYNDTQSEIRFGIFNDPDNYGDSFYNGFYFFDRTGKHADYGCGLAPDSAYSTSAYKVLGNVFENPELMDSPQPQAI